MERRLIAIFAADMVGYSRLMGADEVGTLQRQKAHRAEVINPALEEYHGRIVKEMGDGILLEFPSVVEAVQCAVVIQRKMVDRETDVSKDQRIQYRIGINLGDIIIEDDDIFGDGVNVAARIEAMATPGGICISGSVRDQVGDRVSVSYADLGEQTLKNIAKPVRIFSVVLNASGSDLIAHVQPELPKKPSIAVLPFLNASGAAEQEFMTDGISEDIVAGLATLKWLFVIARSSTDEYKARSSDTRQIGRELGVRYLLDGTIRCSGDKIRVTAHLIEAESGERLWGERYDRQMGDIFAVQDEITQSVIGCLQPELLTAEVDRAVRKPPQNLDAWESFVRGMHLYSQHSQVSTFEALRLLERATNIDETYAQALALRAVCLIWRAFQGWEDMGESLKKGVTLANHSAVNDVNEPWTYIARFFVAVAQKSDSEAMQSIGRAISLSPNFAYAHGLLGCNHGLAGRTDEALNHIDIAVRLSPRDTFVDEFQLYYAFTYFQARRYPEALSSARAAAALRPEHPMIHVIATASQALGGHLDGAETDAATLMSLAPNLTVTILKDTFPFYQAEDCRRLADGLELAGVPV